MVNCNKYMKKNEIGFFRLYKRRLFGWIKSLEPQGIFDDTVAIFFGAVLFEVKTQKYIQ